MIELSEEILLLSHKHKKKCFAFFSPAGGEGVTYICHKLASILSSHKNTAIFCAQQHPGGDTCDEGQCLDTILQNSDIVLVDSSGFLRSPGNPENFDFYDCGVLVIKAGVTRRELAKETLKRLKRHEIRIIGTVLNNSKRVIPNFVYRIIS